MILWNNGPRCRTGTIEEGAVRYNVTSKRWHLPGVSKEGSPMKFSINKTELQRALTVVQKGVSTRSTLPVLSGILIDAVGDAIVLQSTDLELSIQTSVAALIEEPGKVVVPGKLFSDIVKNLPEAAVHVESAPGEAHVTCDTSAFSVKTLAAEDFPAFPVVSASQTIRLPFSVFSRMVRRVARAVSRDESRAILTGILIETEGAKLNMVSTDSYRLALAECEIDSDNYGGNEDFRCVISGSFMNDVAGLSADADEITLGVADNQIIVRVDETTFINRRIEGTYPNYRQLLPDSFATRATFPVEALSAAVHRAALISSSSAPIRFSLTPEVNLAQITVSSADVGSVQESIDCAIEGEDVEIAFNSAYISDGLASIKEDEVHFDTTSPLKPGIFRSVGKDADSYLYLIMPVRI